MRKQNSPLDFIAHVIDATIGTIVLGTKKIITPWLNAFREKT